MDKAAERKTKNNQPNHCSTDGCGMKFCSPCTFMKLMMVGALVYIGFKAFMG